MKGSGEQSIAVGERRGLRAIGGARLAQNAGNVVGNRAEANKELVGNVLVAFALGDEAQYLHLPGR